MLYRELANSYEKLEKTGGRLEKTRILSELYKESGKCLDKIVLLSMGIVYSQGELELGIASETMKKAISRCYGISEKELHSKLKQTGDLGLAAEIFASKRKQTTFAKKELTIESVFSNLRELPGISGSRSQDKKILILMELLSHASGKEAKYLVRTITGDMRIGVSTGVVRDAIAKAFGKEPKEIEEAYDVSGDYGRVAEMARDGNLSNDIQLGSPIRVMLAERSPGLKEAISEFENPAIEMKLDGFRAQIHKTPLGIKIFSRRMEEVTKQFPDIVKMAKSCIFSEKAVVEGEVIAITPEGKPLPFQRLSRRIQRKYEIEKMVKEIPVRIDLFDILYADGKNLMKEPLHKRWECLKKITKPSGNFCLIEHIETKNLKEAEKFYKKSLNMGEEGVIVKNLNAHYQPGKRVGYWLKVKPIMDPLDVVILGGTWGEGKRASWIGSLELGIRDSKTGNYLATGMLGSGLTETQLEEVTAKMKKIITEEQGQKISVKPRIVIEVAYEEIQKSPTYPSGFALRFPRLLRFRDDEKTAEDADTLQTLEKLFQNQRGRKKK